MKLSASQKLLKLLPRLLIISTYVSRAIANARKFVQIKIFVIVVTGSRSLLFEVLFSQFMITFPRIIAERLSAVSERNIYITDQRPEAYRKSGGYI